MGFFGFLQRPDLGQGLERFAATPNALLLDVRTQEEYADGHIPESRNLPLQTLGRTELLPPARETPLFVYCLSGVRSRQAAGLLRRGSRHREPGRPAALLKRVYHTPTGISVTKAQKCPALAIPSGWYIMNNNTDRGLRGTGQEACGWSFSGRCCPCRRRCSF